MPMCGIRRAATSERRIAPTFPRGNGPGLRLCSGRNSKRTHRIHRHRWLPSVELRGFGNFKYVWLVIGSFSRACFLLLAVLGPPLLLRGGHAFSRYEAEL